MRLSLPQLLSTTCLSAAVAAGVLPLANASAATKTWNSTSSTDWLTAGNWSASGVPAAADTVVIDLGAYGPDVVTTGPTATNLYVGNSGTGTLSISNGGTASSAWSFIGNAAGSIGTATVTGTGSRWMNSSQLRVGESGSGILSISDGGMASAGSNFVVGVGSGSMGTLSVSTGGTVSNVGGGYLGLSASSTGTATVTGTGSSWISTGNLSVARSGTASLTIQDGGTVSNAIGYLGEWGGSGTATVTGTGSHWTNSGILAVGNAGTGALTVSGGGTVSDTNGYVGNAAGSVGTATVTGTGSHWTNSSNLHVGSLGTGTLTISNGGMATATADSIVGNGSGSIGTLSISSGGTATNVNGYVGNAANATGTVTVTGTGSSWQSTGNLSVARSGTASLTIQDGGTVSNAIGYLGEWGGTGTATVTGTGSHWTNSSTLAVGNGGTGMLTISNGGSVSNAGGILGSSAGSAGVATVAGSGSSWQSTNLWVGYLGNGQLTVSNGASLTSDTYITIGRDTGGTGTMTVSNGATVHSTSGELAFNGGAANAVVTGTGSSWAIDNNLSLATSGAGDSLGTGSLTVSNGGTLAVGGTIRIAGDPNVATASTGHGTLNIGADALSAAAAPGTLSAATVAFGAGTGSLVFNHTGTGYAFAPSITGGGTIRNLAGTTNLTGDLSGFTGSTQLSGGTLSYGYGGSSSISTALSGTGGFVVASGGTTTLTGNSSGFAGITTVEDGSTLSLNGALGGALSVNSGGTLKGSGTAATVAAGTGGSIAPGNSIGTLTVTDITFTPGSIYEAEIDANGNHDLIHATGTATLTGGQVAVSYAPGTYLPGMSYTLLTADGGITGTFDSQTDTLGTLFMETGLSYDASNVTLNLIQFRDFAAVADTQNQRAAANAAQSLGTGNPVYNHLVVMQDATAARAAFDSLSGEVHASTQAALVSSVQSVNDVLLHRLETISQATDHTPAFQVAAATNNLRGMIPARRYEGAWVQGFGSWGSFDGNSNSAETHARDSGVLMGIDSDLNADWQGGVAAGYSVTDIDANERASTASSRNYHATAYAGMRPYANQPVLRLGGGFSWHEVDSTRNVGFGGFSDRNSADYDAWTAQAFADLSQPFAIGKGGSLSPFGTLAYLHQATNSFTESGGPSALHVDGAATDLATTTLGIRGSQRLSFPHRDIKQAALSGSMGWRHLIGDDTPTSAVQFASGGSGFAVDGTPMARNALVYDTAVTLNLNPNASLGLRYGGQLAPEAQEQSLSGEFRWAF